MFLLRGAGSLSYDAALIIVCSCLLCLSLYQHVSARLSGSGPASASPSRSRVFILLMRWRMLSSGVFIRSPAADRSPPGRLLPERLLFPESPADPQPALITSFLMSPSRSIRGNKAFSDSITGEGAASLPSESVIDQLIYIFSEGLAIMRYMAAFSSSILRSSSSPSEKPLLLKYFFSSIENRPSVPGLSGSTPSFAPIITAALICLGRVLIIVPIARPSTEGGITPTSTSDSPVVYMSVNAARSMSESPIIESI